MKTGVKIISKQNWGQPGSPLSVEEFEKGIKTAEAGPFYTVEESKKMLEEWRKQRDSK
jgi:hypothetical protein